jgi:hypothetical protein
VRSPARNCVIGGTAISADRSAIAIPSPQIGAIICAASPPIHASKSEKLYDTNVIKLTTSTRTETRSKPTSLRYSKEFFDR